ncbi:MAG: CRISPR-associated helicase/endonuclease Cas3, partial [Chloroflexota bacterium]
RSILRAEGEEERSVVLEHHSAVDARENDQGDFHPGEVWRRLAAENWDAPIIVTTTVQLFQSLFACRTQGARKLHRIAESVIILDEAQSLPVPLLTPILDALQQICTHYGASVVLSTATQPAFDTIPAFARLTAREIVPDPARHFAALRRVNYEWRTETPVSWSMVAEMMWDEPTVLTIVNTKRDAMALLDALNDPEALHLSTLLCGIHRRQVIEEVKRRLAAGLPCRLVTTQVVEAGVDLDFPLVLRALAPLDGIIQAAGRCNREGKLVHGRVIVFQPAEGGLPKGDYERGVQGTRLLLSAGKLDPDDPATSRRYFEWLFQRTDLDKHNIQELRKAMDYPEVARRFRMIDEQTESVVVLFGTSKTKELVQRSLDRLRTDKGSSRGVFRALQPYLVSLRPGEATRNSRWIIPIIDGLGLWTGRYDQIRGLLAEDPEPEAWVV